MQTLMLCKLGGMNHLEGKSVVVVGGSRGMGLGIASAAASRGADVVIVGRDSGRLERAKEDVSGARTLAADATREADVVRLFDVVGALDHLIVTAADLRYAPIGEMSLESLRAVIDSKLLAAALLAKHASPRVRAGGSMTFVSGVAADRPAPKGSMVAAVNGALNAFARALAVELAPLRVNTLSPGWVDTPVWDRIASELANRPKAELFAQASQRLPTRRIGTTADIAHAAVFLMESEFTTGSTLYVDGGHRLV